MCHLFFFVRTVLYLGRQSKWKVYFFYWFDKIEFHCFLFQHKVDTNLYILLRPDWQLLRLPEC